MMNEKKHERFIRIVERRMDVLINDFEKLGNCASKVSYDYTEEEVKGIFYAQSGGVSLGTLLTQSGRCHVGNHSTETGYAPRQ